jgi:hypothetical protein
MRWRARDGVPKDCDEVSEQDEIEKNDVHSSGGNFGSELINLGYISRIRGLDVDKHAHMQLL